MPTIRIAHTRAAQIEEYMAASDAAQQAEDEFRRTAERSMFEAFGGNGPSRHSSAYLRWRDAENDLAATSYPCSPDAAEIADRRRASGAPCPW